jgi:uridine phosphorylase
MKASEIILNADNSIYHLGLKQEEVPSLVITVGDPDRVPAVTQYFDTLFFDRQRREFRTALGRLGSVEILVVSTGIGTDNIDIVLNELQLAYAYHLASRKPLAAKPPIKLIRLGTSGALQPDIPVDSIGVAESAVGLDGLAHFYDHPFDKPDLTLAPEIIPYQASADPELFSSLHSVADFKGISLTANGFYGPQGRSVIAASRFPDFISKIGQWRDAKGQLLTNMEMETAGIYALGQALEIKCLSFSAILANRVKGSFSKQAQKTVDRMIKGVLDQLSALH